MTLFETPEPDLVITPKGHLSLVAHRRAALQSPEYFMQHVLGIDIADFHKKWIQHYKNNFAAYVISARGHIKSTWSQAIAAWEMLRKKTDVMTVTYAEDQAKEWIQNLKQMLRIAIQNMKLELKFLGDSKTEVLLNNMSRAKGKGITGNIRMRHPDLIICDDILSERMSISFEEAERIFRGAILGTRTPKTKIIVVGTILRQGDILDQLRTGEIGGFGGGVYPAILDWETKKVLWPVKRSWDYLMQQKQLQGDLIFQVEYMLNPLSDELALVPRALLDKCKDKDLVLSRDRREDSVVVMGVDLQISASSQADYSVFLSLELVDGKMRVLEMDRHRGLRYDMQLHRIIESWKRFNHELILVESNGFQRVLAQQLQDRIVSAPIRESITGSEKHDKETGIPSLRQIVETRKLVIPWGDEYSREKMRILIEELAAWQYHKEKNKFESRARHDDTTMALWKAVQAAREIERGRARFVAVDL